jgi:hypothetical protein
LRVPSTVVCPREGSLLLASFGRVRKVQETDFAVAFGRNSVALKRILEAASFATLVDLMDVLLAIVFTPGLRRTVRGSDWLVITAAHPRWPLECCIGRLVRKVESFLGHLRYPALYVVRIGKRNVYDVVVVGMKDLARVVRHDVKVFADRPPKHGR